MSLFPNGTEAVATRGAPSATAATAAKQADLTILAGNVARCNWTTRPRVSGQALLPAAVLPTTIRRDYVANANDSYWLPNARHPLTPTARIVGETAVAQGRSEEHTSELQSLMRISYAVICLTKKKQKSKY